MNVLHVALLPCERAILKEVVLGVRLSCPQGDRYPTSLMSHLSSLDVSHFCHLDINNHKHISCEGREAKILNKVNAKQVNNG
jgi:hypothetical protein